MQKKLIALAIAGLASGAAFAQSNVSIYGVVDVYGFSAKESGGGSKVSGLNSGGLSGSRLGFKGVEDLGGGLKAVFLYEFGTLSADAGTPAAPTGACDVTDPTFTGVCPAQADQRGNGITGTRQSYVGLAGNFGTAVAGRLQTPGYNFGVKYDPMGASIFSPVGQLTDNLGVTVSGRDAGARQNNAVAYIAPTFAGVTLVGAYVFGEQNTGDATGLVSQDVWAFSADYDNGPLSVGGVYHGITDLGGTSGTDLTEWGLGASYDFKVAKVIGSWQTANIESTGNPDEDYDTWSLGMNVPVGPAGMVKVAYGVMSPDSDVCSDCDAKAWGIDYEHSLSKRTTAYVGYSQVKNDSNINFTLLNAGLGSSGPDGSKARQFALGLRHTF